MDNPEKIQVFGKQESNETKAPETTKATETTENNSQKQDRPKLQHLSWGDIRDCFGWGRPEDQKVDTFEYVYGFNFRTGFYSRVNLPTIEEEEQMQSMECRWTKCKYNKDRYCNKASMTQSPPSALGKHHQVVQCDDFELDVTDFNKRNSSILKAIQDFENKYIPKE